MIISPSCTYNWRALRASPQPFPICLSHGLDAALNFTAKMRFTQTQLHKNIIQVGFCHCLRLCSMAQATGIFPGWTGYFPRKKSGEFQGKIQ